MDAAASYEPDVSKAAQALFGLAPRSRMVNGLWFVPTEVCNRSYTHMMGKIRQRLGPAYAVEDDIDQAAWAYVADGLKCGADFTQRAMAVGLLDKLEAFRHETCDLILPNYAFRFTDDVKSIQIGPVRAGLIDELIGDDTKIFTKRKALLSIDGKRGMSLEDNRFVFHMTKTAWRVRVSGPSKNVRDQGAHLIDTAISLLRFSREAQWSGLVPAKPGEEPHAFEPGNAEDPGFMIGPKAVRGGAKSAPRFYEIDQSVKELADSEKFRSASQAIFAAKERTLGARLGLALAWLTRARRAEQRSDAVLFYFTALETLFSERGEPVSQTISRYVATILSDEPNSRSAIFSMVTQLYNHRSSVVHSGMRDIWRSDVQRLHRFTESVLFLILEKADLLQPDHDFIQSIKSASFGMVWAGTTRAS